MWVKCVELHSVLEVHPWNVRLRQGWQASGSGQWREGRLELGERVHVLLAIEVSHTFECGHKVMKAFTIALAEVTVGCVMYLCLTYTVSDKLSVHVTLAKMRCGR